MDPEFTNLFPDDFGRCYNALAETDAVRTHAQFKMKVEFVGIVYNTHKMLLL